MTVVGWRVACIGGDMYDSSQNDWSDVPDDGVLLLKLYYDRYSGDGDVQHALCLSGEDWYFHNPDTNLFGANSDPLDSVKERYPDAVIKRGKWTTDEEFYEVQGRINELKSP